MSRHIDEFLPVSPGVRTVISESDAVKALVCAIIERAADDVRAIRRQGMLDEDGQLHESRDIHPKLPGSSMFRECARAPARDAIRLFHDGRLERLCALLNSPIIHPDRIKAHIFGPEFNLNKSAFANASHR